ncbi:putative membrane protein [Prauserella shujinwangii]|uniref:Putative membrane protein n=1 Tax=Prauserella shujinwangii TaxID=1453103 RepID=A0A2T0LL81_9PSEU|nr:DUF2238 domain-containing protein [Prauserella shujinwangii]PRX43711.1 putative membrane protein [Prauserella shujinwangii]
MTRAPAGALRETRSREPLVLLGTVLTATAVSGVRPRDHAVWLLEAAPVLFAVPLLVLTYRRFPLTPVAYRVLTLGALMILLGAHYTYAHVPLGEWAQTWFGWSRNHYDRAGHLVQGLVAAVVIRELLIRHTPLRAGRWLLVVTVLGALGVSAGFEIVETAAASVTGEAGESYLATQGDPLDSQWDMTMALAGLTTTLLFLRPRHDRELLPLS